MKIIRRISASRTTNWLLIFVIIAMFFLRLAFGLCSEFWFDDEHQVYLIGLKFYTTGHFPYFGPDVIYTSSQIPGALQGLLIGLPFYILQIPEAPYILLNLLSFGSLCLLAWYIQKKLPSIPSWFVWIWLLSCPWTLNYSTHIINPSYVLTGAILFFIAFSETLPWFRTGIIRPIYAFAIMGFSLFWIYQLHLSWVLLIPFIILSFWYNIRNNKWIILSFLAGCLVSFSLVIPAIVKFGLFAGSGDTSSNLVLNWHNAAEFITVLMRYLSFGACEIPRFIGNDLQSMLLFIEQHWYFAPFIIFAILIGFIQPLYLIAAFFIKNPAPSFRKIRWVVLTAFIITWLSFLFSVKGPSSHTFYLMFPLVMIYSFYCWQPLFRKRWFSMLMALMLFSNIITHVAIALDKYQCCSMYTDRERPLKAIQQKNHLIFGERRPFDRNH